MLSQDEIHRMAHSEDVEERKKVAERLRWNFAELPDKEQATKDLLALTKDKDFDVRLGAVEALGSAFPHVTNKEQATKDLLVLTKYYDFQMRWCATYALGSAFPHITDKEQAWKNLLILINDREMFVKVFAAYALGSAFPHLTDKLQATKDILALTKDDDLQVRMFSAYTLGFALAHVTNKRQATKQLLALTKDKDFQVRWRATEALGFAFQHVTNKQQATKYLLVLTKDEDKEVRRGAAFALGSAFGHVTDKDQATKDLLALTKDGDKNVRRGAASALGSAFWHVTDKEQAWNDLLGLTKDEHSEVRCHAYHSLGRISIIKATEGKEEDFKKELENALEYFENSANEVSLFNPARFCLPFYSSFYTVTFRKEESEVEVKKYIEVAKNAVGGSKSKEKLLEAIENLSNALTEAQKARSIGEMQSDLTVFSRYCNRAADLLGETEEEAPGAVKLIRRGLPIIDERIKEILAEIQQKSEALCRKTKGTPYEDVGKDIYHIGQGFSNIRDGIGLEKSVENLQLSLDEICSRLPDKNKGDVCRLLEKAKHEHYVEDKINTLNLVLSKIPYEIKVKPSLIESLNAPATIAAFVGFIGSEFLDIIPVNYNKHIVSIVFAAIIFLLIWLFTRKKN